MNKEPDLSDQRPDEIRHRIEETRSSLTERLEMLEHQVKQTVGGVPENLSPQVASIVDSVTSKLGGEPVPGSVVSRSGHREPAQPNGVS